MKSNNEMLRMNKIKLLGVGNNNHRYYFKLEKKPETVSFLGFLLLNLGFRDNEFAIEHEVNKKPIDAFNDSQMNFYDNNMDIDIFFGLNSVFLIVRTQAEDKIDVVQKSIKEHTN